ncbi:hypothetical protein [Pseudoalteromonas sp. OF7H-1]|uniref:hypothetical protein n=1 Tax=Pseudoalteromonas sp. OF7H-1 TaxID=2917755 RepID=UPI001EF6ADAB|nr:hypothetical protein [Pseudoalteromonas sp. OF7H-1]MCG7540016.1 hypothetical protein [Pseudoalteromonas sp. OF7H-1]
MVFGKGRIGIITGAGPDAGLDLFSKILHHNKELWGNEYAGDLSSPEVLMYSLPELGYAIDISNNEERLWLSLEKSLNTLNHKVDVVCIACNVLHYFSSKIKEKKYQFEFISVIDVVESITDKHSSVAMLSISKVIDFGAYSPFREVSMSKLIETPPLRKMDDLVKHIKLHGGEDDLAFEMFQAIIDELNSDFLILACTDLPLLPLDKFDKNFIDISDLLAKRVAETAYSLRFVK